jgi:GAF domain-containing protein
MTDALRKPIAGLQVSIDCHSLDHVQLVRFLERRRANPMFPLELSLADNLSEVLRRANGFVPSASGCILLDDPQAKQEDRRRNLLTFIAAFGDKSEGLVGRTIPGDQGIAGRVYMTGETYVTSDAPTDRFFYKRMDEETRYQTNSLIAVPIRIEQEVCGVLELINRKDASAFSQQDRNLLEVFAGYISISIQNVLDGRQAQEIAKRDNLTGLYNDRYLHIALADSIRSSGSTTRTAFWPAARCCARSATCCAAWWPGSTASPPATAATSSSSCCPTATSTRRSTSPRRSGRR